MSSHKQINSSGELIFLGMFDISRLGGAMSVRIASLSRALETLGPVRLITGNRQTRRHALIRLMRSGKLRQARAIYVEASTSAAGEADILFLALARQLKIPIVIFIPDGYQLFPTIFPRQGWKMRLLDWGWRISVASYQWSANLLLFPSFGLAHCFENKTEINVFPPAGLAGQPYPPLNWRQPTITYFGAATYRYGSDLLLEAMSQVVKNFPQACCRFVTNEASFLADHPERHAPWLTVESRTFNELPEIAAASTLMVAPLRINPYNSLAMPVKLFDYMSFGRPTVATACHDMAQFVTEHQIGIVVEDTVQSLANGIIRLLENQSLAEELGRKAYDLVQTTHNWEQRAVTLWQMIEAIEQKN